MIPKIIHYCWFGKGLMPQSQKDCIKGWRRLMPDYTIMRWDESTFDLTAHPLAAAACRVKRYALASDICRYNVLAQFGGIYLDTDVELFQRLDPYLDCNFFSAFERYREFDVEHVAEQYLNSDGTAKDPSQDVPHMEILTSTMGCCAGQEMIVAIRDYYNGIPASDDWALNYRQHVNNDRMVARYLTRHGLKYIDQTQHLDNGSVIYGTGLFGYAFSPNPDYSVSYHHNAATWCQDQWNRSQKRRYWLDKLGLLTLYKRVTQWHKKKG